MKKEELMRKNRHMCVNFAPNFSRNGNAMAAATEFALSAASALVQPVVCLFSGT